jgi:UDP-N-acetyl-D-mannosaminuronic acid transferase (WecB/TagA/CpsF family)
MKKETLSRKKTKILKGTEVKQKKAQAEHERYYSVFGLEDNFYDEVNTHRARVTTRIWQSIKGILLVGLGFCSSLPL